jgi:hypothetical protein
MAPACCSKTPSFCLLLHSLASLGGPQDDPSVSRLLESVKAAKARPAFAVSMPSDEFIAAAYFTYAAGAPAPACD